MISNQLTTFKLLSNNELTKLDSGKCLNLLSNNTQQFSPIHKILSINANNKCDDNIKPISTPTDSTDQSTLISGNLFSRSKPILNEHNPNLILTKQNLSHQIHRSISTSDYIDWTNHQSNTSSIETTINNQLDAINFLQEYLQNGNRDVLINLLYEIAQEINIDQYSYSARNNNHFHLTPTTFNSNLQLSNNKEKKNKKEKSGDKGKTDSNENKLKKEDSDDVTTIKKPKKHKEKKKKTEETTTTTDSEVGVDSPPLINPIRTKLNNPKSPSYSATETTGFPSFSIPVPHTGGSSTNGLASPDPSRIYIPQQSNIAYLSHVQHQLQTDPQNSSLNKTTPPHNMSVQQQLQSLSQMARDGDEILITLSVNALTQKQQINNNNTQYYQPSFQNNPYSQQPWNQTIPSSTRTAMPRNLEIVAKGFARVQNEHPQPPPSNPYPQQQQPMMQSYNQPSFAPRYPNACYSNSGPPQIPIGPPVQPIFAPPNMMMSDGFIRPRNTADFPPARNRSHLNNGKCDYLCQSSLHQPDFRGRPSPGVMINPYFSNPINFSAKQSSKHKTKTTKSHKNNSETINRTSSSIY